MKCLKPIIAYYMGDHKDENGNLKKTICFSFKEAAKRIVPWKLSEREMTIPCGKCDACLKNKRLDQSIRIIHEVESHEDNCFITLTYNDDNLPMTDGQNVIRGVQDAPESFRPTLSIDDYQRWLKRFRKRIKKPIRYFIVGEYGAEGQRPHYHAIIFGWKPDDLQYHKFRGKYWTYRSAFIESTWKHGFSEIGIDVNAGVAKYCAQYVTKKFIKHKRPQFVLDEFVRSSKMNGGIGAEFLHKFHKQVAEQGYIFTLNRRSGKGYRSRIPSYYVKLLEKFYKDDFEKLQSNREVYLEYLIQQNEKKTREDWEKYFEEVDQKVKYFREMQKRQVRSYEQPETKIL